MAKAKKRQPLTTPRQRYAVMFGEMLWDVFPDGTRRPGGAPFNVAFHCNQLGMPAYIMSRVGNDDLGKELLEFMKAHQMPTDLVTVDPELPTGTVQVTKDSQGQPQYQIAENVAWDRITMDEKAQGLLKRTNVLYYGTLAMRGNHNWQLFNQFEKIGGAYHRFCDLNFRKEVSGQQVSYLLQNANYVKLSVDEAKHMKVGNLGSDPLLKISTIVYDLNMYCGLLTNGAKGFHFCTHDKVDFVEATPVDVVDTVGAGDALVASFIVQAKLGDIAVDLLLMSRYAAEVCRHPGATPVIPKEVWSQFKQF